MTDSNSGETEENSGNNSKPADVLQVTLNGVHDLEGTIESSVERALEDVPDAGPDADVQAFGDELSVRVTTRASSFADGQEQAGVAAKVLRDVHEEPPETLSATAQLMRDADLAPVKAVSRATWEVEDDE